MKVGPVLIVVIVGGGTVRPTVVNLGAQCTVPGPCHSVHTNNVVCNGLGCRVSSRCLKMTRKALVLELIEAALDQPNPTDRLKAAVQAAAKTVKHEDALK